MYSNQAQYGSSNDSYTWHTNVRFDSGMIQRVEIQAKNAYEALELFKALYGSQLISESVGRA
jgi:hypothetical protein